MKIAVASGKGGTGKTTLAVNLALAANGAAQLLDCDVEAPNVHLFLNGRIQRERVVTIPIPEIDAARCNGCDECSEFCRYNAIASFGSGARHHGRTVPRLRRVHARLPAKSHSRNSETHRRR